MKIPTWHEGMGDGYLIQYPTGAHRDIVPRIAKLLGLMKR